MSGAEKLSFSLSRVLLDPDGLVNALREHWRNPIQASVEMNSWFGSSPRLVLQLGSAVRRLPKVAGEAKRNLSRAAKRDRCEWQSD